MRDLFSELKRRNVVRVAVAYFVVAWVFLQVAEVVLSLSQAPAWVGQFVLLIVALGYVPALIFSWFFEITPEGLKRETEIDRSKSTTKRTGRNLDYLTICAVIVAVVLLAWNQAQVENELTVSQSSGIESVEPTLTLGVGALPFENLSPDPENAFFASGVHEEVLTHLSRISGLRVISRTSMLRIAETDLDVRAIGARLGVTHVLEGSVRRSGDQVRVTVKLLDAAADQRLWSQTYEHTLIDVFAVQSSIALAVAEQLNSVLSPEVIATIKEIPTQSTEAYDLYLRAVEEGKVWRGAETFEAMKTLLEQAVAIDPGFLRAQVRLVEAYGRLLWIGADPQRIFGAKALELVSSIRRRWPERIEGRIALGHYFYTVERDYERALAEYRAVEAVFPNHSHNLLMIATALKRTSRYEEFLRYARRVAEIDPESLSAAFELSIALEVNAQAEELMEFSKAMVKRFPEQDLQPTNLGVRLRWLGDAEEFLNGAERLGKERFCRREFFNYFAGATISSLSWLLLDRRDLKSAVEHIENCKTEEYGWTSVRQDIDLSLVLRKSGRADQARDVSARALEFVSEWIQADRAFPDENVRFWYSFSAWVAAVAGDLDSMEQFRTIAASKPAAEPFSEVATVLIEAYTDSALGDAKSGWSRLDGYLDGPMLNQYVTPQYAAICPFLHHLFGEVPKFRSYIASENAGS